jgi:hypothetical protein
MSAKAPLITANRATLTIDGTDIPGLQAIEFTVDREQKHIFSTGTDVRQDAYYGGKVITGSLTIKSLSTDLNKKMYETVAGLKHFQIVCTFFPQGEDAGMINKVTFDGCYLKGKDFKLPVTDVGSTTYHFTAAEMNEE